MATPSSNPESTAAAYKAGHRPLPYWLLNVPENQWPSSCPPFLTDISARNLEIVNSPEAEFRRLEWEEVRRAIRENRIDDFRRTPLDHRNYLCYMARLKKEHGSVMEYVRDRRLGWTDLESRGKAFEDLDDIKIIYNDWPYGIDRSIVHLCVWTKFSLDVDEKDPNGDLTPEMRGKIDKYVERTFGERVPAENIIWFKNWAKLKSIHSMEHFHVMMKDPDMEFVKEITNGDSPASSQFAEGTILG